MNKTDEKRLKEFDDFMAEYGFTSIDDLREEQILLELQDLQARLENLPKRICREIFLRVDSDYVGYSIENLDDFTSDSLKNMSESEYVDVRYDIFKDMLREVQLYFEKETSKRTQYNFSDEEKIILRSLDGEWTYIARDEHRTLYVFTKKPHKDYISGDWVIDEFHALKQNLPFDHLFQQLSWDDPEPCRFEDYL